MFLFAVLSNTFPYLCGMEKENTDTTAPKKLNLDYQDEYITLLNNVHQVKHTRETIKNESFIIILTTEGWCKGTLNDKETTMSAGDMLICSPGNIMQNGLTSMDFRSLIFIISSEHVNDILKGTHMSLSHYLIHKRIDILHLTAEEQAMIQGYYNIISSFSHMTHDVIKKECVSRILQSISYAFAGLFFHRGYTPKRDKMTSAEALFGKFIRLLKEHPDGRTVQFYADKLNITPKYFNSICKQISGKTASTLICEEITNMARALLKDPELSIKQIAIQLGFVNQSHFGSFIRRETGFSPQHLRKESQLANTQATTSENTIS